MRTAVLTASLVLAASAAPAPAFASNTDSMRVWGIVPVMCSIEGMSASFSAGEIDITFDHSCNTTHAIVIQAPPINGEAWVTHRGERQALSGGQAVFLIPMGHFMGAERYTIEYPGASAEDLDALAGSLQFSLQIS